MRGWKVMWKWKTKIIKDSSQASCSQGIHSGIPCLGWGPLLLLSEPPFFFFFFFLPILVSATPYEDYSSPFTGCNHLKVESYGLIIFVYPMHSGFAVKVYQMSIITFALSHYKFLLDKKYTFMTLHSHSIYLIKKMNISSMRPYSLKTYSRKFPGSPVVRTLNFHCRGHWVNP